MSRQTSSLSGICLMKLEVAGCTTCINSQVTETVWLSLVDSRSVTVFNFI